MPEGDSIRKAASLLAPVLEGSTILRAASRWPSAAFGLEGKTVLSVEPIGKNLWIPLQGGTASRIHLGMRGRFHLLPPAERWKGSLGNVSLLLETEAGTVVCTGAPRDLGEERWRALYGRARALMLRNLAPGRRETTTPAIAERYWVYQRAGRPCLICSQPIAYQGGSGDLPRPTWWCEHCQAPSLR